MQLTHIKKIIAGGAVAGALVLGLAALNYFSPDRVEQRERETAMERARLEKQRAEEERLQRIYEMHKDDIAAQEEFFRENAKRPEVVSLANGLQYEVLQEGSGASPDLTDRVVVHYRGNLLDGTEFDDSRRSSKPLRTSVSGVIPGWQEVLPLMKEGAVYKVYVPYQLAYAEKGAPPLVPPYAALIFEIELLEVIRREPAPIDSPQPDNPD